MGEEAQAGQGGGGEGDAAAEAGEEEDEEAGEQTEVDGGGICGVGFGFRRTIKTRFWVCTCVLCDMLDWCKHEKSFAR